MAITVSWVGYTRINDSNSNTNWGNWGSTGGAPGAEAQLAYQGGLAVNKKITSSTLGGIDYDPGSGAVDMSTATGTHHLWFPKVIVSDSFDLNTTYGISLGIGSANNAYYAYNAAGSGANNTAYSQYPAQGGYLITAIDPNISFWREATQGSPSLTAVDWFGAQAALVTGAAKSENLALDAIDVGSGLRVVTTASDIADFIDFISWDQDTTTNRYGVVTGSGNIVRSHGMLEIGTTSTECDFSDSTSIVLFPDGYHSSGLVGVTCNISSANSVQVIDCQLIGEGAYNTSASTDTRPDFITVGTSGTLTVTGQLLNHRNITLTSAATCNGATLECELLTQSSADIKNCSIFTTTASQVACLQDPTFGTTIDLNNCDFVQAGSGHAIEITSTGTHTFTGLRFSGYGANTTNSAAIYNNSGGAVTIQIAGGGLVSETTYRNGTGASTTVSATFNHTLEGLEQNTEVTYVTAGTSTELYHVENATTSDGNGKYKTTYTHDGTATVDILIHHISYAPDISNIYGLALPSSDAIVKVQMFLDDNYLNPA